MGSRTTTHRTRPGTGEDEDEGTRTQTSRNSGWTRPIQPQDHEWLAEGTDRRGRPPASGRDAEELRPKTSELTQKTKNAASQRHTRGAWLPHRLPPPTHDVHAGRNVGTVHAARRPTTLGYSEDRMQHREHGAAQDRHRGHPSGSGRDRASRRCRRRRHRTWRRVTVGHAEQVPKRQRNEWTRVHRSPHTEAAEGANPISPPRGSRRRPPTRRARAAATRTRR